MILGCQTLGICQMLTERKQLWATRTKRCVVSFFLVGVRPKTLAASEQFNLLVDSKPEIDAVLDSRFLWRSRH